MGSPNSKNGNGDVMPVGAYMGAVDASARRRGVTGGYAGSCGECNRNKFLGSDDMNTATMREYADTLNSSAKSNVIKELIKVGENLGLLKGATGDDSALIKTMLKAIPSGDKIKRDPTTQKGVCERIAASINQAHGNQIINTKLPAEVVCQHVAEVVSSLSAGMHTEFLAVYEDVRKVLKNLHALKEALGEDHEALMAKVKSSDDTTIGQETADLSGLHDLLLEEITRQILLLENLLNVTLMPAEKDLAQLIKSKKDIAGYIDKIDVKLGSDKFGKVIADILFGLGVTANFALLVETALKKVGISLDDYAKGESVQKLREQITSNAMGKNLDQSQLHDYLNAAELLYKNFYRNKDIAGVLKTSKTGSGENIADMYGGEDNLSDMYAGGASEYRESVMDKRVSDRKKLRKLIFNTFYRQINAIFDQLVGGIDIMTMKVGTEIPLSEELNGLRHILQRVNEELVRNKQIYFALIGYYNDAMSKSKKDTLLGDLKMLSSQLDIIIEMSLYGSSKQYFVAIQSNIKAITGLIDRFSDEIAAKFGRDEESKCPSFEGGDGEFIVATGGDDLYETPLRTYKVTKTLHDAIRQFDYKYRVAQIKQNLSATGKELEHYSEKYEKLVANSIADILTKDQKIYKKLRKHLSDDSLFGEYAGAVHQFDVPASAFSDTKISKEREEAIKFIDHQWDVKRKFWATIEAVDSYMRIFTDGIAKDPNSIKEIKSMLEEVETISDWYREDNGNGIAGVFDYFPSWQHAEGVLGTEVNYSDEYTKSSERKEHYYVQIGKKFDDAVTAAGINPLNVANMKVAYPGNPYLVTLPSKGMQAVNQAKKALGSLSILKNLMSVFVHIGSTFGGQELRKQIFMTPTQMYNNLLDYLEASAFTQGINIGDIVPDGDDMPVKFTTGVGSITISLDTITGNTSVPLTNQATYVDNGNLVRLGLSHLPAIVAGPVNNAERCLLFKKRWGVWMRSIIPGLKDYEGFGFKHEDDYFVMVIKSIAAKILTVTGLYNVFDRPAEFNGLSPIRMITGGSNDTPKVDEGAVSLYLRLPLLAQFYRRIFGFDEADDGSGADPNNTFKDRSGFRRKQNSVKVSLVPDIEGTFSGLIRFIFRKTRNVESNAYSEADVKELIREVNTIYQKMQAKHPKNTTIETIHEFVAEINRRYGIITKDERNEHEREFGFRYDYSKLSNIGQDPIDRYRESPNSDIAILPGEGDDEIERPSGAQKLLGETFDHDQKISSFTISPHHKALVYDFRCAIDKYFEDSDEQHTFNHAIKSTQFKLKSESNDENRIKLITSLVRGVDVYSKVDGMKYVLFQETVVNGLNMLSAVHTMLARFKQRVQLIDLRAIEDVIWKYFDSVGNKLVIGDHAGVSVNSRGIRGAIRTYLVDECQIEIEDNSEMHKLIGKLLGANEDSVWEGGSAAITNPSQDPRGHELKRVSGIPTNQIARRDAADANIEATAFGIGVINGEKVFINNIHTMRPATNGLFTILRGEKLETLKNAYTGKIKNDESRKKAETFMRFVINREFVMKELIESIFGFGNDFQGLVECKIEDGKIYTNYGGLKTLIEDMFQHVSYFIDLLRSHVSADIITKYTDKFMPGSYYWLHEQLMEKIILGRPKSTVLLDDATTRVGYASLDELMQKLSYTFARLTHTYDTDGGGIAHNALANVSPANAVSESGKNHFDKVFAEMIFYDASRPNSGVRASLKKSHHAIVQIADYIGDQYDSLRFQGSPGKKYIDPRFLARFEQLYSWGDDFTLNRSALFSFNQLVAKYIQSFYDPISGKIYGGLITQFANGSFNNAVLDFTKTYPDTIPMYFTEYKGAAFSVPTRHPTTYNDISGSIVATANVNMSQGGVAAAAATAVKGTGVPAAIAGKYLHIASNGGAIAPNIPADVISTLGVTRPVGDNIVVGESDEFVHSTVFDRRFDPDNEHVLFSSLSIILNSLITSRIETSQALQYIYDNVADVPLHMKEKMRANLPAFRNLFKELISRCELLKKFINVDELSLKRLFNMAPLVAIAGGSDAGNYACPMHNPWPWALKPPADDVSTRARALLGMSSVNAKTRFMGILDTIIQGSVSLATSCEQTLREVGDDPKYFEMYSGSIKDYKFQYGVEPLMPLSSSLASLKNRKVDNFVNLLPIHSIGNPNFKFMFGIRSLINNPTTKPMLEHVPGFASIVNGFNLIVDNKFQADKSKVEGFLKTFTQLLRYVFEAKHTKGMLTPYILTTHQDDPGQADPAATADVHFNGSFNRGNLMYDWDSFPRIDVTQPPAIGNFKKLTNRAERSMISDKRFRCKELDKYLSPVYSITNELEEVVRMTESSFKDDKIKELVDQLCANTKTRNSLEIQNIIDLNIVPINVHALMREVPLINLYNYSYTFDRMIIELYYGLGNDNAKKLIKELCNSTDQGKLLNIKSSKDMLVALLIDPYKNIFSGSNDPMPNVATGMHNEYEKFAKGMLVGVSNTGNMGRPKFLSDQIYNKAIFGELYTSPEDYNEMGPPTALIARTSMTFHAGVGLMATIMFENIFYMFNARGQKMAGALFVATTFSDIVFSASLRKLCGLVARAVATEPHKDLTYFTNLIYERFLDHASPIPEFENLVSAPGADTNRGVALYISLVAKLVHYPVAMVVNSINSKTFTETTVRTCATMIGLNLLVIKTLGDRGANTANLGITLAAPGAMPAYPQTHIERASAHIVKAIQPVGATLHLVGNEAINNNVNLLWHADFNLPAPFDGPDANLISLLPGYTGANGVFDRILRSILGTTLPVGGMFPANGELHGAGTFYIASLIRNSIMSVVPTGHANTITSPTSLQHLHYLTSRDDVPTINQNGVGLQRKPHGDNDNVLDSKQVASVNIPPGQHKILAWVGRFRFDTIFIRNLIFLVNMYRSIRMKLSQDLMYNRDIVTRAGPITDIHLTEFFGNQVDRARVDYEGQPMWNRYNY